MNMMLAEQDGPESAEHPVRRLLLLVLAGLPLPAAMMLIGRWEWAIALVAVACTLGFAIRLRNRRTREGTDERARELHRRAAGFSWQMTAAALTAVLLYVAFRHDSRAIEPYLGLVALVMTASYLAALTWHRRNGL